METQSTPGAHQNTNLDSLEEFDFRPVTEGLGFHHGGKAKEAVREAQRVAQERSTPPRQFPREEHPFTAMQRAAQHAAPAQEYVQDGLSLFYADKRSPMVESPVDTMEDVAVEADRPIRFMAFLVDVALLAMMCAFTLAAVGHLTGFEPEAALFDGEPEVMAAYGLLFTGYFLLYFTVMEKFQGCSLGKEVLGLKVTTQDGGGFSLMRSFARAISTLLGFVSLGATAWADLPGKLTATRVVKG